MRRFFFILLIFNSIGLFSQTYVCAYNDSECAKLLWRGYLTEHVDNDFEKALSIYLEAIDMDSTCCDAYNFLALAYTGIGDYDKAIELYFKSLSISPGNFVAYARLGRIYNHQGLNDEAIVLYKKSLEILPSYTQALQGLSEVYLEEGNLTESYYTISNAILIVNGNSELTESEASIYKTAGIIFYLNDVKKAAIEFLLKAYTYMKNDAELNYYIAKYYDDINNKEAKSYFKKAVKLGYLVNEQILIKYDLK